MTDIDKQIQIRRSEVLRIANSRKMIPADIPVLHEANQNDILHVTKQELADLALILAVKPEFLLGEPCNDDGSSFGVHIARHAMGYSRTAIRNEVPYYTYHHLATASSQPSLMPLRIEVHCEDESKVSMNSHSSPEFIFVEQGVVTFHWEDNKGQRTQIKLDQGDSTIIRPHTPHSFTRLSETAQIIAINF